MSWVFLMWTWPILAIVSCDTFHRPEGLEEVYITSIASSSCTEASRINIWVVRGLGCVLQCFVTPHTDLLRACYYIYLWCEGSTSGWSEAMLQCFVDQHLGRQRPWMGVATFCNAAHQSLELLLYVSMVWGINIWVNRGFGWVLQCFVTLHTDLSCQPVITWICCARDQHLGCQRPQMENYNKYRSIHCHLHNLLKEIIQVRSKTQFHSGNKIDM